MFGETHRGGQNISFMSSTKRLCLINHVLPKLAQCLALFEARWELLSMAITVSFKGKSVSLIGALSWSPELPWKELFSLGTTVFLQWILAFGHLPSVFPMPAKACHLLPVKLTRSISMFPGLEEPDFPP